MKRSVIHVLFALPALALLSLLMWQWTQFKKLGNVHNALSSVPVQIESANPDLLSGLDYPEVKLATASALAKGNQFDAAETLFNELLEQQEGSELGMAAQYNLANTYLREASRDDIAGNRKRPLLELAKQHYRNVLRNEPQAWNARYNLERALRLAPELPDTDSELDKDPVKSVDVVLPGFKVKDLP